MLTSSTQMQNRSLHIAERTGMSAKCEKNDECTCKACKTTIFRRQVWNLVTFSLPSSSWLLKLPSSSGCRCCTALSYKLLNKTLLDESVLLYRQTLLKCALESTRVKRKMKPWTLKWRDIRWGNRTLQCPWFHFSFDSRGFQRAF